MTEAYIGVSGVGSGQEQATTEALFSEHGFGQNRRLLLGVKATTKTQVDELEPTKGRAWFPVGDELSTALVSSDKSTKVLQFYADDWTDLNHRALPLIDNSLERASGWVNGIQYDLLPWFSEDSSLEIIERYGATDGINGPVILQCYGAIMREHSPADVIERLKRVEGYVTHVLFDASEGRGISMDSDALVPWVEAVQLSGLGINVAVAGGLGPLNVNDRLSTITERFNEVSWDAESQLHSQNVLDNEKVSAYLTDSKDLLLTTELPRTVARDIRTMGEWSIWLAHIERQPTYLDGRHENDSEHASMLSRVAVNIALKYFPELDAGRVSIFSTIHDDVEGYTSDFHSLGASEEAMKAKQIREDEALAKMKMDFADFPHYIELIEIYEQQIEPEARFVKVLDKCMPPIMNLYNKGKSVLEEQSIETADQYTDLAEISSKRLVTYTDDLGVLIRSRAILIQMIRDEVYDQTTGTHLKLFQKKDE